MDIRWKQVEMMYEGIGKVVVEDFSGDHYVLQFRDLDFNEWTDVPVTKREATQSANPSEE